MKSVFCIAQFIVILIHISQRKFVTEGFTHNTSKLTIRHDVGMHANPGMDVHDGDVRNVLLEIAMRTMHGGCVGELTKDINSMRALRSMTHTTSSDYRVCIQHMFGSVDKVEVII